MGSGRETLIAEADPLKEAPESRETGYGRDSWQSCLLLKNRILGILLPKLGKSSLIQRRLLIELISWGVILCIFLVTPFPGWLGAKSLRLGQRLGSRETLVGAALLILLLMAFWSLHCWIELGKRAFLSETDPLTGLFNRRYLRNVLGLEMARVRRHPRPLSLIMFDIDDFKRINDRLGHAAGDEVLKKLAAVVRRGLRDQDCLARWGGDEFVVIAPETDLLGSYQLAERLRYRLAKQNFNVAGRITASFGVCRVEYRDDVDGFLNRVDRLLYLAKERGKNVVQTEPINLVARAAVTRRTQLLA